jgi:quercetin dioxygenase-like cupin family protein
MSTRPLRQNDKPCAWRTVTIAPGANTTKHGHTTDHMLVAVSGYELTDQVEGKRIVVRARKSGGVEYLPAGITHRLTKPAKHPHASS